MELLSEVCDECGQKLLPGVPCDSGMGENGYEYDTERMKAHGLCPGCLDFDVDPSGDEIYCERCLGDMAPFEEGGVMMSPQSSMGLYDTVKSTQAFSAAWEVLKQEPCSRCDEVKDLHCAKCDRCSDCCPDWEKHGRMA